MPRLPIRPTLGAFALTLSACGPATTPPSSGSTGAFGVVTVNGTQKMYLPVAARTGAGNAQLAVVDVGKAGNGLSGAPALIRYIDLGTSDPASTTGGDARSVLAASTHSDRVWLVDPQTDTLVKSATLPAANGISNFSGGGGHVTGIALDPERREAVLSVWNGFAVVDAVTLEQKRAIPAPATENFAFDAARQRVFAPFYMCEAAHGPSGETSDACGTRTTAGVEMKEGMTVIDLSDDTVYVYQDPAAPEPDSPLGGEPDAAAVDTASQVVVVPSESGGFQNVLDFAKASFNRADKAVTAPARRLGEYSLEGVAIEPSRHLAFLENEFTNTVGVMALEPALAGNGVIKMGTMPPPPGSEDGAVWANLGDPHGIAVTTSLAGGKPVGFLVDEQFRWVARVDLEKLQAIGSSNADLPDVGEAVTFLEVK